MTWGAIEALVRTYSYLKVYHEQHPEDLTRADGDIVTRFMRDLKAEISRVDEQNGIAKASEGGLDEEVEIEWPLDLVMYKRK